jgi:hypothetical protein
MIELPKMKLIKFFLLSIATVLTVTFTSAQNYQAIHGSSYAGSLGPSNNPSSIVHVPYSWDITPLAVQLKHTTNAVTVKNFSLLSGPKDALVYGVNGTEKRYAYTNQNIRLLNTRIKINPISAIAFGINVRSYSYLKTDKYSWQDTVQTAKEFFSINTNSAPISAEVAGSAWAELYGTYAKTIKDDGNYILNGGITLKVVRGLGGAYANLKDLDYAIKVNTAAQKAYLLTNGLLQYGYSNNFDTINNGNAASNRKAFFQRTFSRITADAGIEYILPSGDEEGSEYDYDTKIGISIMDIGSTKYTYSKNSRIVQAGKANVTDSLLQSKFRSINSFDDLNDSLADVAGYIRNIDGDFFIKQPTRLIINVDRHLAKNIFINGELTVPLTASGPGTNNKLVVRDMNLLALTPRWETKILGLYMPVLINHRGQFWVGGAFKAGPLLLGIHNWANVFSKNKIQRGGLYLALTFRPGKKHEDESGSKGEKLPRKLRQSLDCPKF